MTRKAACLPRLLAFVLMLSLLVTLGPGPARSEASPEAPQADAAAQADPASSAGPADSEAGADSDAEVADAAKWLSSFGLADVEEDENGQPLRVNGYPVCKTPASFNNRSTDRLDYYDTWFCEYPFWGPATGYEPNLAAMSLNMALSADRPESEAEASLDPSEGIVRYLTGAGFSDIRKDDYYKVPTQYTVSSAIGSRVMEHEGEEPFTLIAVAVCGSGYHDEWISNFDVGMDAFHQGFRDSADLIVDRVSGYIATRGIQGRIKLWMSGFSRSAAVSNIAGGLITASGMFPKEDIFVYTFATPAGVISPPAEGYENIFNIMGASDPVPQMAPAEWNFDRYGINIILPSEENATFLGPFFALIRKSNAESDYDINNMYNPGMNLRMRLLFAMILDLMESRHNYYTYYQSFIQYMLSDKSPTNRLQTMNSLIGLTAKGGDAARASVDRMVNYLLRVTSSSFFRNEFATYDNNSGNVMYRLANEHTQDSYLASMELLRLGIVHTSDTFSYVMVRGNASLKVENLDYPEYSFILNTGGEVFPISGQTDDQETLLYAERIGNTSVVAIPHDCNYRITWTAEKDGTLDSLWVDCNARMLSTSPGARSASRAVKAGDTGVAFLMENYMPMIPEGFTQVNVKLADLADYMGIGSVGLHWRTLLSLAVALPTLLICLLFCLFRSLLHGRQGHGFLFWLVLVLLGLFAVEAEMAFWFFVDLPIIRILWKILFGIALIALFFLAHKADNRPPTIWLLGLILYAAGNVLINISLPYAALPMMAFFLIVAFTFIKDQRLTGGQWLIWATFSLLISGAILLRYIGSNAPYAWLAAALAPAVILALVASSSQPGRIRFAMILLALATILQGGYVEITDSILHITGEVFLDFALILLATHHTGEETAEAPQPFKTTHPKEVNP